MYQAKRDWDDLYEVVSSFAHETEIPQKQLGNRRIALQTESRHNHLSVILDISANNREFEFYAPTAVIPDNMQGAREQIARRVVGQVFRGISPFMPEDDNRLFVHGHRTGLDSQTRAQIGVEVLDALKLVQSFDDEHAPKIREFLASSR